MLSVLCMTLLLSATTPAPSAVSATFVAARPPALRDRVPLLDRIRQAAPTALVTRYLLLLPRPPTDPSTATGNPKASPTATILTPQLFRSTTSALTKSFLTTTSISSVTPKPDLPSCPLLASSSLNLPPMPMSQTKSFCFYVLLLGANSHFRSEGSLSGGLLFHLCSFSLRLCLEG